MRNMRSINNSASIYLFSSTSYKILSPYILYINRYLDMLRYLI